MNEKTIHQLLADGANLISNREGHDLPLWYRRQLWIALGDKNKRAALAIESARRVQDVYKSRWPQTDEPIKALALADEYQRSGFPKEKEKALEGSILESQTVLDNLLSKGIDSASIYAGYAANTAAATALYDESGLDEDTEEVEDSDIDPYEYDAAFYASATVAGAAPWDEDANTDALAEFWTWYLETAKALSV